MSKHRRKGKRKPPVIRMIPMNPIPPDLVGLKLCAFNECLATATRTICDEPELCYRTSDDDEWCRQYILRGKIVNQLGNCEQSL